MPVNAHRCRRIFTATGLRALLVLLVAYSGMQPAQAAGDHAAGSLYRVQPPPAWVVPAAPQYDAPATPEDLSNGTWFLMLDRQIALNPQGDDDYRHTAIRVVNASGVESNSQINFGVDPSFQTLALHALRVVRDGQAMDRLHNARITALPQESNLEQHIYNGGYNINVVLSDVRAGDVIEYEYTLHSVARLYPGHYSARLGIGWSVPVLWQRIRLLHAADRALRYRFTSAGVPPQVRQLGGLTEQVFQWRKLPATAGDDDRPAWYQAWPVMEVSDFTDWPAVAREVNPLFMPDSRARPRLQAAIAQVRDAGGTPQQQVMRALRYVQGQVRYTSISIGRGSHMPSDPETVLERRFGDCKDKALLLSMMLRGLGIDARPALVNTERGPVLQQSLPTPFAFDHAIARVQIGDAVYWLDATAGEQHGALAQLEPADYGYALPVAADTAALERIPRPPADAGGREVTVDIDLSQGYSTPASFDVTTRYRGAEADTLRNSLGQKSAAQRQADYLNYYARYYQGLRALGAMTVDDDTDANLLVTHEHYAMDEPFARADSGNRTFRARTDELYRYGSPLTSSRRQAPLAVSFPDHVRQIVRVRLPDDWTIRSDETQIDNPAFRYRSRVSRSGRVVTLDYEYQALADHVPPEALATYAADRAKLNNDIDYRFSRNPEAVSAPLALAPAPLAALLVALGMGVWLMRYVAWRYDPAPRPAATGAPQGIGGWLLLPGLNLLAFPLLLAGMLKGLVTYIDSTVWLALPGTVSAAWRDQAQPVVLALLGGAGLLLPLSLTVLLLFLKRRTSAPALFVVLMVLLQAYSLSIIGVAQVSGIPGLQLQSGPWSELAKAVIFTLLWGWYLLASQRVKATFTTRLGQTHSAGTALALHRARLG